VKGLALATIGLWVVLQTTYGPLATKVGLITGASSSTPSTPTPSSATKTPTIPGTTIPTPNQPTEPIH
jgi:hypothetical protein